MSSFDLHVYGKEHPETPDICGLIREFSGAAKRRMDEIHRESVGYIPLTQRLTAMARRNGHSGEYGVPWGWNTWSGLHVTLRLKRDDGFDAAFDYIEAAKEETLALHRRFGGACVADPEPDIYAYLKRKTFTFKVAHYRFSLMIFAHDQSEACKVVEVGTEPKYELVCSGSTLPSLPAAAE